MNWHALMFWYCIMVSAPDEPFCDVIQSAFLSCLDFFSLDDVVTDKGLMELGLVCYKRSK
jgi:hypothetical protein